MPNALRLIHKKMQYQPPTNRPAVSRNRTVWRGLDLGPGPEMGRACPKPQAEPGRGPWGS